MANFPPVTPDNPTPLHLVRQVSNQVFGVLAAEVIQKVYPDFANATDRFGNPILIRRRYIDNPNYSREFLCWQDAMRNAAAAWNQLTRAEQEPFYKLYRKEGYVSPFGFYFWLLRRLWAERAGCEL